MIQHDRRPNFCVCLLGRFEVRAGDDVVLDESWGRRKAKALLKRLALQCGHVLHREQLMEMLWPDLDPSAAANNLYKNLHYLRTAFSHREPGDSPLIVAEERVALALTVAVDADAFRSAAEQARDGPANPAPYERALALYHGLLLPGDPYEEWAEHPRRELSALQVQLLMNC